MSVQLAEGSAGSEERARLRAHALELLRGILGQQVTLTADPDGRPRIHGLDADISISNKCDRVAVAVVPSPERVGIDLENLTEAIDAEAFERFALAPGETEETVRLQTRGWSKREAAIAFWCVKESFCKSAGYPFRPADLRLHWSDDAVHVEALPRLQRFLDERDLRPLPSVVLRRGEWLRALTVCQRGACAAISF